MRNAVFFIAGILIVFMFYSFILFYNLCLHNPPLFANSEIWLKNTYLIKDYINSKPTSKQRLLIVSDSNSLFGFNGALIDSATRFKPINYATHGGLPLNFHIDKIIANAKSGDIIFMPLNFSYYTRENPQNDLWYIQNMLTWNKTYTKFITSKSILKAYIKNDPKKMIKFFVKSFMRPNPQDDSQTAISTMESIWRDNLDKIQPYVGYDYKSLSPYGDFCAQSGSSYKKDSEYLSEKLELSKFFISEYKRLLEFAREKNIKVFLTYPATLENKDFSLNDPKTFSKIENLKAQLKKHNIEIYGDFRDFHFEREYIYDTNYHLNDKGAILRTKAFIRLLEQMQKDELL